MCLISLFSSEEKSMSLPWHHNEGDGVSNHQHRDCLLDRLFRRGSKKTSKLHVTGHCEGNSPVTGKFPAQRATNSENVSIRWRHHMYISELNWGVWFTIFYREREWARTPYIGFYTSDEWVIYTEIAILAHHLIIMSEFNSENVNVPRGSISMIAVYAYSVVKVNFFK